MTIVAADLAYIASERMIDYLVDDSTGAGGGGYAGSSFVQDGISNDVFPDVMPTDAITGRLQLRLVYAAVLSLNDDVLSNASVGVATKPTDSLVDWCVFEASAVSALPTEQRNSLDAAKLLANYVGPYLTLAANGSGLLDASDQNVITSYIDLLDGALSIEVKVGDKITVTNGSGTQPQSWRTVVAVNSGAGTLEYSGEPYGAATTPVKIFRHGTAPYSVSAGALSTASTIATATSMTVDRCDVRVLPVGATLATPGVPALGTSSGLVPCFKIGDRVLVQHPSTPATREIAVLAAVNYNGTLTFVSGLTNAYPIGTKVCRMVDLGSLGATLSVTPFSQQTWTRVWQSSRIGSPITPQYSGVVGLSNAGAEDDRYAIVFRNTTQFDLVSERRGQIAAGNIATDFIPLNPLTGEPLFVLYASAWGAGWLGGNALRFDVAAAHEGAWVARCISPGAAVAAGAGSLVMRGDVDA